MGLNRRSFLKFIAGAGAGTLVTPIPWKILDDVSIWTQNWSWSPRNIPGPTSYVKSVSKMCPSSVAVKVRLAGTRPVRVLPADQHPLGGGISPLAAAEVQMMYSPSRITKPLKRSKDNFHVEVSWKEVAQDLGEAFTKAGSKSAFISGDENGSMTEVMCAFADAMGTDRIFLMPSEAQSAARAMKEMGINGRLGYDFENSDCILAIGADILESFGPVVANRKAIVKKENRGKLFYAGPVRNNTASIADKWLPLAPNAEGELTLGIAAELIRRGRNLSVADFAQFKKVCETFTLERTAELTGLSTDAISEVVDNLLNAKAPLVLVGSPASQGLGAAPIIAAFALNALLDNINKDGGLQVLPEAKTILSNAKPRSEIFQNDLVDWLHNQDNRTEILLLHEANPVFALPNTSLTKKALEKIPLKVAFTSFMDETAKICDYILPIPVGLERNDDVLNPYGLPHGIYCASGAAAFQPKGTLYTGNILMYIANSIGKKMGYDRFFDLIERRCTVENGNIDLLMAGEPIINKDKVKVYSFSLKPNLLAAAIGQEKIAGTRLVAERKLALGTPTTGIPPFNTKLIKKTELIGKDMFVRMNKATASKHSLQERDRVKISNDFAAVEALVHIDEGVAHDTIAGLLGLGHTAFDEFSQNKGANLMDVFKPVAEAGTNMSSWASSLINITKV